MVRHLLGTTKLARLAQQKLFDILDDEYKGEELKVHEPTSL